MDDRRRDGGTNSTLRTKEQGTHLTLNEHDDVDDDDDVLIPIFILYFVLYWICCSNVNDVRWNRCLVLQLYGERKDCVVSTRFCLSISKTLKRNESFY